MVKKGCLLEIIQREMGCAYLSDLRGTTDRVGTANIIKTLDATQFSTHEWMDAAGYITGVCFEPADPFEIRERLLEILQQD